MLSWGSATDTSGGTKAQLSGAAPLFYSATISIADGVRISDGTSEQVVLVPIFIKKSVTYSTVPPFRKKSHFVYPFFASIAARKVFLMLSWSSATDTLIKSEMKSLDLSNFQRC